MVESQPSKLLVASSNLVSRFFLVPPYKARIIWFLLAALSAFLLSSCIERRQQNNLGNQQSEASMTLEEMVLEDQTLRADPAISWDSVAAADRRHRETVFSLLARGQVSQPRDLFRAAVILQHAEPGECRGCYLLAHHLAVEAVRRGFEGGRYLAAATIDRYLMFTGSPQRYGTQYTSDDDGRWSLYPVDPATTDSMRSEWQIPPLDSLKAHTARMNPSDNTAE